MLRFEDGRDLCLEWAQRLMSRPNEFPVGLVSGGRDDGIDVLSAQLYAQSKALIKGTTAHLESFFEKNERFTQAFDRLKLKIINYEAILHEGSANGAERLCQAILSRNCSYLVVAQAELVQAREWHKLAVCRKLLLKASKGLAIMIFGAGGDEDALLVKMAPLSGVVQKFKLDLLSEDEVSSLVTQFGMVFAMAGADRQRIIIASYSRRAGKIMELLRVYRQRYETRLTDEHLVTLIEERNALCVKDQDVLEGDPKKKNKRSVYRSRSTRGKKSTTDSEGPSTNSTPTEDELGLTY